MIKVPFEDEKPAFHTNQKHHGPSEPFVLSGDVQVPYTINRYLRDYQREGVKFIYDSYLKSRGCILGDDMGLGKTIQVCLYILLKNFIHRVCGLRQPGFLLLYLWLWLNSIFVCQVISYLAGILQKTGTWQDVENNRPDFLQSQVPSKLSKVKKVLWSSFCH